mmetsp:Transcript_14876/g.29826  ORF Transcript_14876/g.29826 Transcript_14876/m.29826 type:complete len:235 (-) Transcript_14876:1115-1819(-)
MKEKKTEKQAATTTTRTTPPMKAAAAAAAAATAPLVSLERSTPRTLPPAAAIHDSKRREEFRSRAGPISCANSEVTASTRSLKSSVRRPEYRYAITVRPMVMSGCANSEDLEGTSLPRKGTAKASRLLGTKGSSFSISPHSEDDKRPNDTRLTFCRQCGRKVRSQSWHRFRYLICSGLDSSATTFAASRTCRSDSFSASTHLTARTSRLTVVVVASMLGPTPTAAEAALVILSP